MRQPLARPFALALLLAGACFSFPAAAHAQGATPDLDHINLTYHGGPLVRNPKVVSIFWGADWQGTTGMVTSDSRTYLNSFFQTLFADGAFLANLAQYSANGYQIGSGAFVATVTDTNAIPNPNQLTDAQIQTEIAGLINAGKVPAPDADTIYFVFTPPGVTATPPFEEPIAGYHWFSRVLSNRPFAYSVIPPEIVDDGTGNQFLFLLDMGATISHELAEIVTDPQVTDPTTIGWFDANNGEVGDIVDFLASGNSPRINIHGYYDILVGTDFYFWVEKMWSNRDQAPVAFAQTTTAAPIPVSLTYHGGPLIQQPKVSTLFWGGVWTANPNIVDFFNNAYKGLFDDQGYMANLAQYSANGMQIGNGSFETTATDGTANPNPVTDLQIQNEISAQIDSGKLSAPDTDTVYHVFLPPGVVMVNASGKRSDDAQNPFVAYHSYSRNLPSRRFAYIVSTLQIVRDLQGNVFVDVDGMTAAATGMLANTVTDPQIGDANARGWYDANLGEVGDIVRALYNARPPRLTVHGFSDMLLGNDIYLVQKVWSNKDKQPAAFVIQGP